MHRVARLIVNRLQDQNQGVLLCDLTIEVVGKGRSKDRGGSGGAESEGDLDEYMRTVRIRGTERKIL